MVSVATCQWLRWHAGLAHEGADVHDCLSVAACINSAELSDHDLGTTLADLLAAMVQLNVELNGDVPSESREADDAVPRAVAFAVAEIARLLRRRASPVVIPGLTRAPATGAWLTETAWEAVLAGDIDDLRAHIDDESTMLGS